MIQISYTENFIQKQAVLEGTYIE